MSKNNSNRKEQWKDIQGLEGLYQVSSRGRVRDSDGKLVQAKLNKHTKYPYVSLKDADGTWGVYTVHRLVA